MQSTGFRGRLVLVLALTLGSALGGLWFTLTHYTYIALEEDEVASLERVAAITVPLVIGLADDPHELSQGLSDAQRTGKLESLQVLDELGETVAPGSGMPASILLGSQRLAGLLEQAPVSKRLEMPRGAFYVHAQPLSGGGHLFLARSTRDFDERRHHMNRVVLFWAIALMLGASIAAAVLVRIVVFRPIEELLRQAARIATGAQPEAALADAPSAEFGALRKSIRDMAARINKDRDRIQRHAEELQHINFELVQTQNQLIRTEKLASVGQLAAGMAHEIGNPIGIILGYTEMLEAGGLSDSRRGEILAQIRVAIDRIDTTIKDILNYSRPAEDEASDAFPTAELQSVIDLLRPQKRFRNVAVEIRDSLPPSTTLSIPPSRLKQVLLNLLLNAADAMSSQGTVTVELTMRQHEAEFSVTDTGPGIPPELEYRIFDPFFTTKEVGKGTGLGLFVCQTVINTYGGTLSVDGRPGQGARFVMRLPAKVATARLTPPTEERI